MDGYKLHGIIYADRVLGLQVHAAWSCDLEEEVILKVYSPISVQDTLIQVKTVFQQARGRKYPLVDVFVSQEDSNVLTFGIACEKTDQFIDLQWMRSSITLPSEGYAQGAADLSETEASARTLYRVESVEELTSLIRMAFAQAIVSESCEANGKVLDIFLEYSDAWTLSIVTEKCEHTLQRDFEQRIQTGSRYSEEELLRLLSEASTGLAHAKTMVESIQRIPHIDLQMEHFAIDPSGAFKLFGYKKIAVKPHSIDPDPFKSDVYALGLICLHLANLSVLGNNEEPNSVIETVGYSPNLKRILREMLEVDTDIRLTIEQIRSETALLLAQHRLRAATANLHQISVSQGEELTNEKVLEMLEEALAQKQAFHYEDCLCTLQRAWLASHFSNPLVGEKLGEVLGLHFARYGEAENVIRKSCEVASAQNPTSEELMRLRNVLGTLYFNSGRYREAELHCKHILETFADCHYQAELYWVAVYNRFYSLYRLYESAESVEVYRQWEAKITGEDSALSQVIKAVISGIIYRCISKDFPSSEQAWLQALNLSTESLATSMFCALSHMSLGLLYHQDMNRMEEAESHYRSAEELFSVHYPRSLNRSKSLYHFSRLCETQKKYSEAESAGLLSHAITGELYPTSIEAGYTLIMLAALYELQGRGDDAIQKRLQAHRFFLVHYPLDDCASSNLWKLRPRCFEAKRPELGLAKYLELYQLLASAYPTRLATGKITVDLADYYKEMGLTDEAIRRHKEADATLFAHYPEEIYTPINLYYLANIYEGKGQLDEAITARLAAHKCYSEHHAALSDTAHNLYTIADIYKKLGRVDKAIEKRLEAHEYLLRYNPEKSDTPDNLANLAMLYEDANDIERAVTEYKRAHLLYSTHHTTLKNKAFNLSNSAVVYGKRKRFAEAEIRHVGVERFYLTEDITCSSRMSNLSAIRYIYKNRPAIMPTEEDAQFVLNLGLTYEKLGMHESALIEVTAVLEFWRGRNSKENCKNVESILTRIRSKSSSSKKQ